MNRRKFSRNALISLGTLSLGQQALALTKQEATNRVEITQNHSHDLVDISFADFLSSEPVTYNIQGSSRHPHTIELSSSDFQLLLEMGSLEIESSVDRGHSHIVRITLGDFELI